MYIDIIIFAIIAIAVAYKFYNQLGTYDEDTRPTSSAKIIDLKNVAEKTIEKSAKAVDPDHELICKLPKDIAENINKIKSQDKKFSLTDFIKKAEAAYEIIVEAFSKQDLKTLNNLCESNIIKEFEKQIAAVKSKNQILDIDVITVTETKILGADIKNNKATINVEFLSQQIIVVKDKQGNIMSGDSKNIEDVDDRWSFTKDIKSNSPIWKLAKI